MHTGSVQVFNWGFVSAMVSTSVAVIAVANTIGGLPGAGWLRRLRISRPKAAMIASLLLSVYAAYQGEWSWHVGHLLEVAAYALILFCVSAGMQESVFGIAQHVAMRATGAQAVQMQAVAGPGGGAGGPGGAGGAAGMGGPAATGAGRGWWASWF